MWQCEHRFLSGYDYHLLTTGAGKAGLRLRSQAIQAIGGAYAARRKQARKTKLRWCVSAGSPPSLGWIPLKASATRYRNGQVFFTGEALSQWDSYGLAKYKPGAGNFSGDARRQWHLNIGIRIDKTSNSATGEIERSVGIDLGLKDFAATSDARAIKLDRYYRKLETKLAKAQRTWKSARARVTRENKKFPEKPVAHGFDGALVEEYGAIFIGNVTASALARTRMAKSVLDAGWNLFRTMPQFLWRPARGTHS